MQQAGAKIAARVSLTIDGFSGALHQGYKVGAYASGWRYIHECTMSVTNQLQSKPPMQCSSAWQYVFSEQFMQVHSLVRPHVSILWHSPIACHRPAPFGPATLHIPLLSTQ
ncbi:hypothetical protein HaLaN_09647 [Haematococcus lacustris]|uniref:Uncharacterized protein n=1 Tax=Haematococcus lacustris TaxID=44745 RepID=A0A699YVG3_HAELA|nr:hypothetical protein HaLaN_09647 [Haematococcus lacustris]